MNSFAKFVALIVIAAAPIFAADLKQEAWHTPIREYQDYDSVIFPLVDYALIKKIKIGMTIDEVKQLTGFSPVNYYIHPDYALLATKVGDIYYEVALLHKKEKKVQGISFRKNEMKKEPNQAPEPTAPSGRGSS